MHDFMHQASSKNIFKKRKGGSLKRDEFYLGILKSELVSRHPWGNMQHTVYTLVGQSILDFT